MPSDSSRRYLSRIALTIFSGVMGRSLIQMPVALAMAWAAAPRTGSVLPSPISLAPNGPRGSDPSIHVSSVAHRRNDDESFAVVNRIEDTLLPHAQAIVLHPPQLLRGR